MAKAQQIQIFSPKSSSMNNKIREAKRDTQSTRPLLDIDNYGCKRSEIKIKYNNMVLIMEMMEGVAITMVI